MTKILEERLRDAKAHFGKANTELVRHGGKVPTEVGNNFQAVIAFADDVDHWIGMIQARSAARQLLNDLECRADDGDLVPFGVNRILFQHARLIGVQAYLATNWALADRLTGMVGRVLCIKKAWNDPKHPPQLVSHFTSERSEQTTAAILFGSVRQTFGWPISISYALRNHFVHDGGQLAGADFFDGPTSRSRFIISEDGWAHVQRQAKGYGADPIHHRAGASWPATPRDDLRVLLDACERETDDALGILVGSACRSLVAHIGCMLGAD